MRYSNSDWQILVPMGLEERTRRTFAGDYAGWGKSVAVSADFGAPTALSIFDTCRKVRGRIRVGLRNSGGVSDLSAVFTSSGEPHA